MGTRIQHSMILGMALFALYFGSGNLIFPPSIGHMSGTEWGLAMIGFSVTGIVLPLLAVIAILNVNGKFESLTRPISPWFYTVFNLLLMVGIGVFVTVPRMAATTHELGVGIVLPGVPAIVTIAAFFTISFFFAMDKSNVIDRIGKYLTPVLVGLLLYIVFRGVTNPVGEAVSTGVEGAFSKAFINAYQTGDIITGIFVAPIFIAAIARYGYKGKQARNVALAGTFIAGAGLLVIYGGLLYIGAGASSVFPAGTEGTTLVSAISSLLLGQFGGVVLAIAIGLACLTSTIGVITVIADFLDNLTQNKLGYRSWAFAICVTGTGIALLGVGKIVDYAMPIFTALYPVAIVLVLLGVFNRFVPNAGAYRGAILMTFIVSLTETLGSLGVAVPLLTAGIAHLPLASSGFAWAVPAIIGLFVGVWLYGRSAKTNTAPTLQLTDSD